MRRDSHFLIGPLEYRGGSVVLGLLMFCCQSRTEVAELSVFYLSFDFIDDLCTVKALAIENVCSGGEWFHVICLSARLTLSCESSCFWTGTGVQVPWNKRWMFGAWWYRRLGVIRFVQGKRLVRSKWVITNYVCSVVGIING